MTTRTLAFGPMTVALGGDDDAAAAWLAEAASPWFAPAQAPADWHVTLSSAAEAYAALGAQRPSQAARRACFAHDTRVVALPAWPDGAGNVVLVDEQRSCFVVVGPGRTDIVGDPRTRRWRMTSLWVAHEIAAARLRRTHLDIHAAAIETAGRAILIVGPKTAGKTTLALHLLRAGGSRAIANDRVFAGRAGPAFEVRGVPTTVTIRPPTAAAFPELIRGRAAVERPYLHTLDELAHVAPAPTQVAPADLSLTLAQLMDRLAVTPCATAPLGAVVFPEIRADATGWTVADLAPREIAAGLRSNLYGSRLGRRPSTVFEDLAGGFVAPAPDAIDTLATAAPGYRVILGPDAYAQPGFATRLRAALLR
jgi:hypothetical protein